MKLGTAAGREGGREGQRKREGVRWLATCNLGNLWTGNQKYENIGIGPAWLSDEGFDVDVNGYVLLREERHFHRVTELLGERVAGGEGRGGRDNTDGGMSRLR